MRVDSEPATGDQVRTDELPLSILLDVGLGETASILKDACASLHELVTGLVVSGSRGPKRGARPDSDIDLSLLVDSDRLSAASNRDELLREVTLTTLNSWQAGTELDMAVVLDTHGCGLGCFLSERQGPLQCALERANCFGVYKLQKGFRGHVTGIDLDIRMVRPMILIWRRYLSREQV